MDLSVSPSVTLFKYVNLFDVIKYLLGSLSRAGLVIPALGSYETSSVRQSVSQSVSDESSHTSCH